MTRAARTRLARALGLALALLVCLAALGSGCEEGQGAAGERGEGDSRAEGAAFELPAEERAQGRRACERYAERVCACAEKDEDLEEECALARARPDALEMVLGTATARGDLEPADREAAVGEARRIIEGCFEAEAALDPATCPRIVDEPSEP